jgi:excisionase family DNA binding protein
VKWSLDYETTTMDDTPREHTASEGSALRALVLAKGVARDHEDAILLHATEVAHLLGLGRSKVYEMTKNGQLPVVRIGTAVRIPKQALLEWIDQRTRHVA